MKDQYVIYVVDDPANGFELIGPFENSEEAVNWAEKELRNTTWYVMKLTSAEDAR